MSETSLQHISIRDLDRLLPSFIDINIRITQLNKKQRANLLHIDEGLLEYWKLGKQIVLSWCPNENGIDVLFIPYYLTSTLLVDESECRLSPPNNKDSHYAASPLLGLIKGSRKIDSQTMEKLVREYNVYRVTIDLPYSPSRFPVDSQLVDDIVKRYSISYVENIAVTLFDIVGFSKYSAFEQVTLINSLAYSINSAHSKLKEQNLHVEFARTTTGDGFYIWNRAPCIQGNINIYHMMHLVLADNAIARTKSHGYTAPILKTAFHIGNYYEYYQSESLHPTKYNFIVGDVTIELARMVEKAMPGQILVGDFWSQVPGTKNNKSKLIDVNTESFIELLQDSLSNLQGLELANEHIESIKCYLTGQKQGKKFSISRYMLTDKHQINHFVYNAKTNIYRKKRGGDVIFLGIQEHEVDAPGINLMD